MSDRRRVKRGAAIKRERVYVGAWVPDYLVEKMDAAIRLRDIGRSEFLRDALKEKIARRGTA